MQKIHTRGTGAYVRQYSETYLPGIVALYREVFREPPWNLNFNEAEVLKDLRGFLDKPVPHVYVATGARSEVIGISAAHELELGQFPFLTNIITNKSVYGAAMAIKKEYREQGIATLFLYSRKEYYKNMGFDFIVGRTKNPRMESVYISLGYCNTGVCDPVYKDSYYFVLDLKRN